MIAGSVTMESETTGSIIERPIAGDEVAFARIIADHHEDMVRIAYLVTGSLDLAEEAVQAAWAIAWRRLGSLRDPTRLRAWLMSVAANEARQMTRSSRRRTVRELAVGGPTAPSATRCGGSAVLECHIL
jgi:RNA polymerase sigma-70 factor, ECF subfamily